MAKKKQQYPNKKRNTMIASIAAVLLVVGLIVAAVVNHLNTGYIFQLDGKRVPLVEYQVHLLSQRMTYENTEYGMDVWNYTDENEVLIYDLARENALSMLLNSKLVANKASEYGIVLTDEDKASAKTQAENFVATINSTYGNGDMVVTADVERVFREGLMMDKMYEKLAEEYVIDEAEFAEAFAAYLEDYRIDYTMVNVNHIQVADLDTAQIVQNRINAGEDFEVLMAELSVDYNAEAENPMAPVELHSLGVSVEALQTAVDMEPGEVSAFEENADGYVMYRVDSVEEEDRATIEEECREGFLSNKKAEIFVSKCAEWLDAADYKLFEKVFANTDIPGLRSPQRLIEDEIQAMLEDGTILDEIEANQEDGASEETTVTDETLPTDETAPTEEAVPSEEAAE